MLRADNATFLLFESDISWIVGIFFRVLSWTVADRCKNDAFLWPNLVRSLCQIRPHPPRPRLSRSPHPHHTRHQHHLTGHHQVGHQNKRATIWFLRHVCGGKVEKRLHALWFLRVPDTKPVLEHKGFFGVFEYSHLPNTSPGRDNSQGREKVKNQGLNSSQGWEKWKT